MKCCVSAAVQISLSCSFVIFQKILHAVSDPSSPRYGQYHTRKELAAIMGPSRSDCEIVMNWFHRHGANM